MTHNYFTKLFNLTTFYLIISTITTFAQPTPLNFVFPSDNVIIQTNPGTVLPVYTSFHIATISSPNPLQDEYNYLNIHRIFIKPLYFDQPFLFHDIIFKFATSQNLHLPIEDLPTLTTGSGDNGWYIADGIPRNEGQSGENKLYIFALIKIPTTTFSHCRRIEFNIKTRWRNLGNSTQYHVTTNIHFNRYTSDNTVYNTPDLFMKDNSVDIGVEPYWNNSIADYTKSTSIRNTLQSNQAIKSHDGINPSLQYSNFAQRSTLGNLNKMNIWIENKSCVSTTSEAQLSAYWTVARLFEPWGEHWHNFSDYALFASGNKIPFTDPVTGLTSNKEMGNHITLADPWNYRSAPTKVTIPVGIAPSKWDFNNQQYTGGFLAPIDWNPPHSDWYFWSSNIFRTSKAEPVFCYLALIDEPNKPNNGFHTWFDPSSSTNITDLVLYNNNAATVNSYLATPDKKYKRKNSNELFSSNIGVIMVDNPHQYEVLNLSFVGESNLHNFLENGNIYLTFDEVLWSRWALNEFSGDGFVVVGPNRIQITNIDSASINGITLVEGQRGMIGVEFEYFENTLPDSDYMVSFSLGAYQLNPTNQIGSPTHFLSHVLSTPDYEIDESAPNNLTAVASMKGKINNVSLFPNPVTDMITLNFDLIENVKEMEINIRTLEGRIVQSMDFNNMNIGSNALKIGTERLSNGIYFLEMHTPEFVKHIKFVKHH